MAKKIIKKQEKGIPVKIVKKAVDPKRESLLQELRSLIPKLDSEGLTFLAEQAKIHLYNMKVEELNKAAKIAGVAAVRSQPVAEKSRLRGSSSSPDENMSIQGTESGSSYYLSYRNKSSMLSRNEMIHLVKISNGEGTDLEIRERLYNWFERERLDIFATIPMEDKFDDRLKTLKALIQKSFKLRKN